jgi:predicted RNA-binding protein with PUA-like domain
MKYWLFKSEPFKWSWAQQVEAADKGTHWNGVRNHLAKIQLQTMKIGDLGFFYHSNEGKEIVGIVEVIKEHYPDPTDEAGKFCMVDVKAVKALKRPVGLAEIKTIPYLENMSLLKSMRLSVQPVREEEWDFILKLSEK